VDLEGNIDTPANHVCTVVNLARELVIVDGDGVTDRWPIRTPRLQAPAVP
jgi:hypothetical protein